MTTFSFRHALGLFLLSVMILATPALSQDAKKKEAPSAPVTKKKADTSKKAETKKANPGTKKKAVSKNKAPTEAPKPVPPKADPAKAKTEPAPANAKKKATPKNPLQKLIKNIFAPKKKPVAMPRPKVPVNPGKVDPNAAKRDRLDDRSPQVVSRTNQLRSIHKLIEIKNWDQAIQALNRAIEDVEGEDQQKDDPLRSFDNPVVRDSSGKLVSFRTETRRLINKLPSEKLELLRDQHDLEANRLLEEAKAANEPRMLAEVAERFFFLKAGFEAANVLGTMHFDRQEFVMAAHWFQDLIDANAPISKDPRWRIKAAVALREAGESDKAAELLKADTEAGNIAHITEPPKDWLAKLDRLSSRKPPVLEDWPTLYGSATRTGITKGGEPLLLSRWSNPSTLDRTVRQRVETLVQDLIEIDKAIIPAFYPLAVNGKAIYRTLRGVEVVDVETGKPLWMTDPGVSAEILLSTRPKSPTIYRQGGRVIRFARNRFSSRYNNSNADMNAITSLLFRNGTYGLISSDGEQLFVLEDHAILSSQQPGYISNYSPERNDPYRRSWSSNRLTAYDLETGRPNWSVGGKEMSESLGLPLSGCFFLGTPVADGGELFVVAEKNKEILLYALDAKSGKPKWAELLAYADHPIDRDLLRRWWPAQVTVGGGVIVCPTTAGWLIAVDRLKRSVLWAYRYSKPTKSTGRVRRSSTRVSMAPLNTRWCASAPVIVGNRVVYTPSETTVETTPSTGTLVCLNLDNGKRVWQKSKGKSLYLAGVYEDRVIVVGSESVMALSLEKGVTIWTTPIAKTDGRPSGRGVFVEDDFYLPLQSGQLWAFNLKTGKVGGKIKIPEGQRKLGNLTMYRGKLLSLTPWGMTAYEQRDVIESQIKERKAKNSSDTWALLREADIHLLHSDYKKALTKLCEIDKAKVDPEFESEFHKALRICLIDSIRTKKGNIDAEIKELESLAKTEEEKFIVQRLKIEPQIRNGKLDNAFKMLLDLTKENQTATIARTDDPNVSVKADEWIAGQLADLWSKLTKEQKPAIDEQITKILADAETDAAATKERMAKLYSFHPKSTALVQQLIDQKLKAAEPWSAEMMIVRLSRSNPSPESTVKAVIQLAKLYVSKGLKADADYLYLYINKRFPDVKVADDQTVKQFVEKQKPKALTGVSVNDRAQSWGDGDLKVERIGTNYFSYYRGGLQAQAPPLPYYKQNRIEYDKKNQRLNVISLADDKILWTTQLRGQAKSTQGYSVTGRFLGHQLVLLHRDVLQCLSPVDKKVIWSRKLDLRGRMQQYYVNPSSQSVGQMRNGSSFASTHSIVNTQSARRRLAIVNSNYILFRGRRKITVVDTLTGLTRWSANRISAQAKIFGTAHTIYVVPPETNKAVAMRAIDGKRVEKHPLMPSLPKAILTAGNDFITAETGTPLLNIGGRTLTIKRIDAKTAKAKWEVSVPANAFVSRVTAGELAILKMTGELELLDLGNGKIRKLGKIDPKTDMRGKTQIYALSDDSNVYLTLNTNASIFYSSTAPAIRTNGIVTAFGRESGKLEWKQTVKGQNMLTEKFRLMPWLVFSSYRYVRKDQLNYMETHITVINKKTGRMMMDEKKPASYSSQVRGLEMNMASRTIILRASNQRTSLTVADQTAKVDGKAKPKRQTNLMQPRARVPKVLQQRSEESFNLIHLPTHDRRFHKG